MVARVEALVDKLFTAFQAGDWECAATCFSERGTISQRFGAGAKAAGKTWAEARKDLEGLVKFIGLPKYLNRQKFCTENSFVEQHVTELQLPGAKQPTQLHAALVGRIDPTSGLILSLEEYLDPSALGLSSPPQGKKKASSPKVELASEKTAQRLDGLVVVVSGSSAGIGASIAMECARRGAKLVLTARREAELTRVAQACKSVGAVDVSVVPGDARDEETAQRVAAAAERFGGVDRLYVNAGISQNSTFMEASVSIVKEQMDINFWGGVLLTRACLPSLLLRHGRIAAVTSLAGRLPAARNTGYAASKHAMHGFFEALRQEVEDQGVRVTMVMPGPVDTDILSNLSGPGGSRVALVINDAAKKSMTSADEAGRIAVDACEDGVREVAFPKDMATKLLRLRATDPEKADAIMRKMYETMEIREVAPAARL